MTIQKIKSGRVNNVDADNFVGEKGTLFFNESVGDLRVSDGLTVGGIPLSFGGGGGGGNYILPTASTIIKGGVKIDGTTIKISNQVISGFSGSYTDLTDKPTIPTNNTQLLNGAGYITSSALGGYATESYVTGRGYITTSALTGYALTSAIPTNNNQLTNGSNYITASALTGLATESYVTGRGYITTSALTGYALTSAIPTDIRQLTDTTGLLGQAGGTVVRNIENPFSFSIAGDDSTLREISNGESIKISGSSGITVTTDAEGNVTITGPNLSSYATQSYVNNSQATVLNELDSRISSLSYNNLKDKPNLAGTYSWSIAADDSTLREISASESVKFVGAGGITTSSDTEGNITITGSSSLGNLSVSGNSLGFYAEGSPLGFINFNNAGTGMIVGNNLTGSVKVVTSGFNAGGYTWTFGETGSLTFPNSTVQSTAWTGSVAYSAVTGTPTLFSGSYNDLTNKPNLAGTYSWSIAADDSTQITVNADNVIKIVGGTGINTTSDVNGNITINGFSGSYNDLRDKPTNANGTFSMPLLSSQPANLQAGQIALANGTSWDPQLKNENKPYLTLYTGSQWIDIGGLTSTEVNTQILALI
jgi:hypothetical protein